MRLRLTCGICQQRHPEALWGWWDDYSGGRKRAVLDQDDPGGSMMAPVGLRLEPEPEVSAMPLCSSRCARAFTEMLGGSVGPSMTVQVARRMRAKSCEARARDAWAERPRRAG
ncbi:MAG TPA: hypothetical protein VMT97_15475 [Terriglobales bacterium]|nr:hypothetical protein [Terriglobales bacterium]